MNQLKKMLAVIASMMLIGGCANMTPQERNTAVGAAVGGVAGSVLTDGGAIGTIGGAAVGGVIGSKVKK